MLKGVVAVLVLVALACGTSNGNAPAPSVPGTAITEGSAPAGRGPAKSFVEGKDYVVLERLRVMDAYGFGQPITAYSILVPKGWKSEGGITWKVGETCMPESIENRLTAQSPDGAYRLDVFPQQEWDWWDDPMMLQMQMQQQQNPAFRRCPIGRPLDAAGVLQGPVAQRTGARVMSVEPNEELGQVMRQQAQAANQQYQQAGVELESRPSAAIATLAYPDGSTGVAVAAVTMLVSWAPNYTTGGKSASYQVQAVTEVALKAPPGKDAEARQLLATVISSTRVNPNWQNAVAQIVQNIRNVEMAETAKRAAIQREAQEYSAQLQQRTWEAGQQSRDRIASEWGRTLRGVDVWNDGSGSSIELNAGYNEAWSRPDGTYILSNDPLFDPNVVLQEDWKRLQKQP
jgi:hypothetical protein